MKIILNIKVINDLFNLNIVIIIVLAVVGNKSDLDTKKQVDDKEAKSFAKKLKASFKKTSAKNGEGINDLLEFMKDKILNPKKSKAVIVFKFKVYPLLKKLIYVI